MKSKRYSAFTLIEMLVVMIILVVIGALSFATYQDMQTTIRLNEYTSVLEENIRRVQREAMLLKREPGEYWIYGLGIDFSKAKGNSKTGEGLGNYTVFKWCAEEMDYGGGRTSSGIPGYDDSLPYNHSNNGGLPVKLSDSGLCKGENMRRELKGYDVGIKPPRGSIGLNESLANMSNIPWMDREIQFILFESVTGRVFFYTEGGDLVGFQPMVDGKPKFVEEAIHFEMRIATSGGRGKGKIVSVEMFSGKVTVGPLFGTEK